MGELGVETKKILALRQKKDFRIVFTNGCFDLLHVGHVSYLQQAKSLGDYLIIGLNSDESVRQLKGKARPLNSQSDRSVILRALRFVDAVEIFNEQTPLRLIEQIRPDVLVKGGDYALDQIVGAEEVRSWGGEIKTLPFVDGKSSTLLLEKLTQTKS